MYLLISLPSRLLNIFMILDTSQIKTTYYRTRNGVQQQCSTTQTVYNIRCDVCESLFTRTSKKLNKRSSAHCCNRCDSKRFAQSQSAILRQYKRWDASSSKKI